jgi:hypothetical protein
LRCSARRKASRKTATVALRKRRLQDWIGRSVASGQGNAGREVNAAGEVVIPSNAGRADKYLGPFGDG